MKKLLLILPVLLLLSCGQKIEGTRITVKAANYDADHVMLGWLEAGSYKNTQVTLKNGKGEITVDLPDRTVVAMSSADPRASIKMGNEGRIPSVRFEFYAERGHHVKISFDADSWPELSISGSRLNDDVNIYWNSMAPLMARSYAVTRQMLRYMNVRDGVPPTDDAAKLQDEMLGVQRDFIAGHPGSILSADLLRNSFRQFSPAEAQLLFNAMSEEVRESDSGVALAGMIGSIHD